MKKVIAVAAVLLALAGCSVRVPPSPLDNYTGTATATRVGVYSNKQGCVVEVKLHTGQTANYYVGRRTTCNGYRVGQRITFVGGTRV